MMEEGSLPNNEVRSGRYGEVNQVVVEMREEPGVPVRRHYD